MTLLIVYDEKMCHKLLSRQPHSVRVNFLSDIQILFDHDGDYSLHLVYASSHSIL